jgi:hypothetical protein
MNRRELLHKPGTLNLRVARPVAIGEEDYYRIIDTMYQHTGYGVDFRPRQQNRLAATLLSEKFIRNIERDSKNLQSLSLHALKSILYNALPSSSANPIEAKVKRVGVFGNGTMMHIGVELLAPEAVDEHYKLRSAFIKTAGYKPFVSKPEIHVSFGSANSRERLEASARHIGQLVRKSVLLEPVEFITIN